MSGLTTTGARVLFVHGEDASRRLFETFLLNEGFDVRGASTMAAAMDLIESDWPEVVLVNQNLPDRSALDFVAETQQHDQRLPILLLSSFSALDDALDALRLGAHDFLLQPILDLELVAEKLRRALEQRRQRTKHERYVHQVNQTIQSVDQTLCEARQALEEGQTAEALEQLARALTRLRKTRSTDTSTNSPGQREP